MTAHDITASVVEDLALDILTDLGWTRCYGATSPRRFSAGARVAR
jgi:hypothetical protein